MRGGGRVIRGGRGKKVEDEKEVKDVKKDKAEKGPKSTTTALAEVSASRLALSQERRSPERLGFFPSSSLPFPNVALTF
jgi:hypothetical protein